MGEAGDFIVEFLISYDQTDDNGLSNGDFGALVRARKELEKGILQKQQDMKIIAKKV